MFFFKWLFVYVYCDLIFYVVKECKIDYFVKNIDGILNKYCRLRIFR